MIMAATYTAHKKGSYLDLRAAVATYECYSVFTSYIYNSTKYWLYNDIK